MKRLTLKDLEQFESTYRVVEFQDAPEEISSIAAFKSNAEVLVYFTAQFPEYDPDAKEDPIPQGFWDSEFEVGPVQCYRHEIGKAIDLLKKRWVHHVKVGYHNLRRDAMETTEPEYVPPETLLESWGSTLLDIEGHIHY